VKGRARESSVKPTAAPVVQVGADVKVNDYKSSSAVVAI
jgi:hypothetical protein